MSRYEELVPQGRYRHYKGGEYDVAGIAMHTETEEPMVLYKALYRCEDLEEDYGANPWFVRPLASFLSSVEVGGETMPRFVKIV